MGGLCDWFRMHWRAGIVRRLLNANLLLLSGRPEAAGDREDGGSADGAAVKGTGKRSHRGTQAAVAGCPRQGKQRLSD